MCKHFKIQDKIQYRTVEVINDHKIHEICPSVTFYFMSELIFWYEQEVTFTKYGQGGTALTVYGEMHFLLISENEFTHEIKWNGITSFLEFMLECVFLKLIDPMTHFQCFNEKETID